VGSVFIWIFWDVKLCRWLSFFRRFWVLLCHHLQRIRGPPNF